MAFSPPEHLPEYLIEYLDGKCNYEVIFIFKNTVHRYYLKLINEKIVLLTILKLCVYLSKELKFQIKNKT